MVLTKCTAWWLDVMSLKNIRITLQNLKPLSATVDEWVHGLRSVIATVKDEIKDKEYEH